MDFIKSENRKFLKFLKDLREESIRLGIPALPESSGQFLALLTYIHKENSLKIVELGSGIGYSVLWMLYGIINSGKKAKIYGVEKEENNFTRANKILTEASEILGFESKNYIEFIKKDSRELKGNEFGNNIDMLFLDIDKKEYLPSFLKFKPYMKKGGIVVAHNVISHKDVMFDFIEEISNENKYFTLLLETDPQGISISFIK